MMNIKKIRPMFTNIVTTCNKYESDQLTNGLITTKKTAGSVKEFQTVVAAGPDARGIKVGDIVMVNPQRYAVMKHKNGSMHDGVIEDNAVVDYKIPMIELNGVQHMLLDVRDVDFVIEEYDDPEETAKGKAAKAGIMTPSGIIS